MSTAATRARERELGLRTVLVVGASAKLSEDASRLLGRPVVVENLVHSAIARGDINCRGARRKTGCVVELGGGVVAIVIRAVSPLTNRRKCWRIIGVQSTAAREAR